MQGKVVWFNKDKGYGFIKAGESDYFIHFTEIKMEGFRTLNVDDKVEFEGYDGEKGLTAKNVKVIK